MKKLLALALAVMMMAGLITGIAAAEESDWDYISGKGKMVVGMTLFAPMNYYEGDEFVGFDTELTKAVGEKLGVNIKFIEINWDSKEIELNSKNIDCIWNMFGVNEDRKSYTDFTYAYIINGEVPVEHFGRLGGIVPEPEEIVEALKTKLMK